MVLFDLRRLDQWSEASPTKAYIQASQVLHAGLLDRAAAAATDEQLADPATFKLVVVEALRTGLSATEIAFLVGAAKSTVARWAVGEAVPRYEVARSLLARKILTEVQKRCHDELERFPEDNADIRIEGSKVLSDGRELEPA